MRKRAGSQKKKTADGASLLPGADGRAVEEGMRMGQRKGKRSARGGRGWPERKKQRVVFSGLCAMGRLVCAAAACGAQKRAEHAVRFGRRQREHSAFDFGGEAAKRRVAAAHLFPQILRAYEGGRLFRRRMDGKACAQQGFGTPRSLVAFHKPQHRAGAGSEHAQRGGRSGIALRLKESIFRK